MASHESVFEAAQRARWMRPDAYRWIRPEPRFLAPGTDPSNVFPAFQRKFSPDQPRVPAGNSDGGQWTDGGGRLEQIQYQPDKRPIDLLEERNLGGHAIERHVGRSDAGLLNAVNGATGYYRRVGALAEGLVEGSFPSLEAANKLVNSTIARNPDKVDKVVNGLSGKEDLDAVFGSPTGSEAYAATERSQPYIRKTYGVRVVIVPDRRSEKGTGLRPHFPGMNKGQQIMAKYKIEVYVEGVEAYLSWPDEREYWLVRKFLGELDGLESQRRQDPSHIEWYDLTKEQLDKLMKFNKELRAKRKGR
jgi:hypothetical protein